MSASEGRTSAVYTVLLGGYEKLNENQNTGDGSVPFLCFTDDENLTSDLWQIHVVKPLFDRDLQRSQREIKIRGCAELDDYDRTLYIDNTVSLTVPPEQILDSWLVEHDIAIPQHSFRQTVLDEFLAVIELGYDEPARVYEQLYHYSESGFGALYERPLWNGMIARRNTDQVRAAMSRWFDEVLRYSRRDQLSANFSLAASGVSLSRLELDNNLSSVHRWPMPVERIDSAKQREQSRVVPDLVRIRELELLLAREVDRAAQGDQRINDITSTRSWDIAQRISRLAFTLRLTSGARKQKSEK